LEFEEEAGGGNLDRIFPPLGVVEVEEEISEGRKEWTD
jgi:hypothetical protein